MENSTIILLPVDNETKLQHLNGELSLKLLPVIIYLIVVMIIGICGNSAVVFIHKSKLKERTTSFFLVYLACLDLLSCCISIPFELSDLFLPINFSSVAACKIFRFSETWLQSLSGLILVCVAFERYRKICKPFKKLKHKVQICSLMSVIGSLIMAVPALVIFGRKTVQTRLSGIEGNECSVDDKIVDSSVITVYYTGLLLTFVFSLVCFLTFYILIGVFLLKRNSRCIGETLPKIPTVAKLLPKQTSAIPIHLEHHQIIDPSPSKSGSTCSLFPLRLSSVSHVSNLGRLHVKTGRMTRMFLAVTISFVLSFVPFLVANIVKAKGLCFTSIDNNSELLVYNFCVRSTFINSAINPVIYSLLNKKFREDCAAKIFGRKRKPSAFS